MSKRFAHSIADAIDIEMAIVMEWPVTATCGETFVPTLSGSEVRGLQECLRCYPPKRSKAKKRPISHSPNRPHYVYRHYDADDRLIYVGCTNNPPARLRAHRKSSWWGAQIARSTHIVFPNRQKALDKEREAIALEQPRWNVKGRWPYRNQWAESDYLDYLTAIREGAVVIGTYSAKHIAEVQTELDQVRRIPA